MLSPKYFLYLAVGSGKEPRLGMSSHPKIDAYFLEEAGFKELWVVRPPQPIWLAETVLAKLAKERLPGKIAVFEKLSSGYFREYISGNIFRAERLQISEFKLSHLDLPDIRSIFQGRSILGTEVPGFLKASGCDLPWDPEEYLQGLVVQSQIQREAAVTRDVLGLPYCRRCGSTDGIYEEYCYVCGSPNCLICNNCHQMGVAKSCTPLYFEPFPKMERVPEGIRPELNFELTPPQIRASDRTEAFCEGPESRFLVWAVCGSGKTEVSFGAVAKVLSNGGSVLYAIPRKDIVIELLPRFAEAFPGVEIKALYGGCNTKETDDSNRLTLATTHQCLRFYHRFDLVVLDEADAFPYQGSAMLHYAVERALNPDGKLIIMSATPSRDLINLAKAGKIPYVSIPARHHRQPLVLPEHVIIKDFTMAALERTKVFPDSILDLLKSRIEAHQKVLIFMPTLKSIETFGRLLVEWGRNNSYQADWTHSRQDNRIEVKQGLILGKLDFLVSSTIFERGITIPNLDVIVLFADYENIYDSRTLIQIAGRVGRYGEPAKVYFAGRAVTRAMKECSVILHDMNQEAFQLGYLDSVSWV